MNPAIAPAAPATPLRIDGHTDIIAHIGYPTHSFKAPLIYNPWFAHAGVNAVVVPMGCEAAGFADLLRSVFKLTNIRGALITMPHKVTSMGLLDVVRPAAAIANACNAVRRLPDGRLEGDLFDGEGFVRGVVGKGFQPSGARVLVVGCGGVGSAIAASLAAAGVAELTLFDSRPGSADGLAERLRAHFPAALAHVGSNDPAGQHLVVNATPLGMNAGDPLPIDVSRLQASTFVGEVVMTQRMTPLLTAAAQKGCAFQVGTDMLFEQIPPYLEFFGLPVASADQLRALAQI